MLSIAQSLTIYQEIAAIDSHFSSAFVSTKVAEKNQYLMQALAMLNPVSPAFRL